MSESFAKYQNIHESIVSLVLFTCGKSKGLACREGKKLKNVKEALAEVVFQSYITELAWMVIFCFKYSRENDKWLRQDKNLIYLKN